MLPTRVNNSPRRGLPAKAVRMNKMARIERAFQEYLSGMLSEGDIKSILTRFIDAAKDGQVWAIMAIVNRFWPLTKEQELEDLVRDEVHNRNRDRLARLSDEDLKTYLELQAKLGTEDGAAEPADVAS